MAASASKVILMSYCKWAALKNWSLGCIEVSLGLDIKNKWSISWVISGQRGCVCSVNEKPSKHFSVCTLGRRTVCWCFKEAIAKSKPPHDHRFLSLSYLPIYPNHSCVWWWKWADCDSFRSRCGRFLMSGFNSGKMPHPETRAWMWTELNPESTTGELRSLIPLSFLTQIYHRLPSWTV